MKGVWYAPRGTGPDEGCTNLRDIRNIPGLWQNDIRSPCVNRHFDLVIDPARRMAGPNNGQIN